MSWFILAVSWLGVGVIGSAMLFADDAHFLESSGVFKGDQLREYLRDDKAIDTFMALFGPFTLVIGFFATGFAQHGLRFK